MSPSQSPIRRGGGFPFVREMAATGIGQRRGRAALRRPSASARGGVRERQSTTSRIASPQVRAGSLQQRHALHVVGHREDAHGFEPGGDSLRAAAVRRRKKPLTCGDAAPGDCRRRSRVARLCESKRAHSEPSSQRAPTVTNDCSPSPWHRTAEDRSAPGCALLRPVVTSHVELELENRG
jgi:hypothetical protein